MRQTTMFLPWVVVAALLVACGDSNSSQNLSAEADESQDAGVGEVVDDAGGVFDEGDSASPDPSEPGTADLSCEPAPGNPAQMPATARQYVALCAEHGLGVPPVVRCEDGVRVPTTVNGEEVFESPSRCDHTSMLKPSCAVGSTIQRREGRDAEGNPLPDVVWVQFCRAAAATGSSSVQMIAYHRVTGATCFFEANEGGNSVLPERLGRDEFNALTAELPAHDDPDFDRAFIPPPGQCVQCHQNNPFIRNPWLDGAILPGTAAEPVLPTLDAASPYYVVGGAQWDMRTIHIEGNECLGCHRVGMEIDQIFAANGFDVNTYMPPGAPGTMTQDYDALLNCWLAGPKATEGCDWVVPPAGDCAGGVVGDDYPYAAADFNQPGDDGGGVLDPQACGDEVVLGDPCQGDPVATACLIDGEWFWCEGGVWTNQK